MKNGKKFMEQNLENNYRIKLREQIKESYGKIVYSFTAHEKNASRLKKYDSYIKVVQIILSALISVSLVSLIIENEIVSAIIGSILSFILLIINSLNKSFTFVERANKHIETADKLWIIREDYISLLTDFDVLTIEEIVKKRDELKIQSSITYKNSDRTDKKSYKETQVALQIEEEQTFKDNELNNFLHQGIKNKIE